MPESPRGRGGAWFAAFSLSAAFAAAIAAPPPAPPLAASEVPAPTLAIVGASASAGFGTIVIGPGGDGPGIVPVRLSDLLRAIPETPTAVIADWSTSTFFRDPTGIGRTAIDRAIASDASLLLGIDFLFWYAYGFGSDTRRLDRFEEGLQQLDRFEGPMILGDVPDMAAAAGGLISAGQVPSLEAIAAANARLVAWAAERPRVLVLPISQLTRKAFARAKIPVRSPRPLPPEASAGDEAGGEPASPREPALPAGTGEAAPTGPALIIAESDRDLGPTLQRDRLHPTFDGLVAITWVLLQLARERAEDLSDPRAMASTTSMASMASMTSAAATLSARELRDRIREGVLRSLEGTSPDGAVPEANSIPGRSGQAAPTP